MDIIGVTKRTNNESLSNYVFKLEKTTQLKKNVRFDEPQAKGHQNIIHTVLFIIFCTTVLSSLIFPTPVHFIGLIRHNKKLKSLVSVECGEFQGVKIAQQSVARAISWNSHYHAARPPQGFAVGLSS